MRKSSQTVILAVAALAASPQLWACGDKYLSVGRGARFQRGYVSTRPASVVVVARDVTARKDFLTRLKLAGHRVAVASNVNEIAALTASTKAVVVLAAYSDAASVSSALKDISPRPFFLPVVDSNSPQLASAHKEYGCLLNSDMTQKRKHFLAVLDEAIESARKAQPVKCDLPKA